MVLIADPTLFQPHKFGVRVYYEDTDAGGIVFYANYLKFAERGRTEFLRDLGFDHIWLQETHGLGFVVRRCESDFLRSARLDDMLTVETRLSETGGARFIMSQRVLKDATILCELVVTLGCVGVNGRPSRLPGEVRNSLMSLI